MPKRIAKLFLIVGLLVGSIWSAKYALADFYYQRAKIAFNSIDIDKLDYARELDGMVEDVDRSLKLRRNAADPLDFKANLLYQSWWLSPDGQYLQNSNLLQGAVRLHEEAQKLRQGWAFSAARLALIYSHQSILDRNFDRWFTESHRLGLYETKIARSLMIIGLRNWAHLSDQQKNLTMDFVRTSIEQKANSAAMMIALLDRYQKRPEVCNVLTDSPRKIKVCESLVPAN